MQQPPADPAHAVADLLLVRGAGDRGALELARERER
jgi:hypothetical protein